MNRQQHLLSAIIVIASLLAFGTTSLTQVFASSDDDDDEKFKSIPIDGSMVLNKFTNEYDLVITPANALNAASTTE